MPWPRGPPRDGRTGSFADSTQLIAVLAAVHPGAVGCATLKAAVDRNHNEDVTPWSYYGHAAPCVGGILAS